MLRSLAVVPQAASCASVRHIHLVQAAASHVTRCLRSRPTGMFSLFSKRHIDKLVFANALSAPTFYSLSPLFFSFTPARRAL